MQCPADKKRFATLRDFPLHLRGILWRQSIGVSGRDAKFLLEKTVGLAVAHGLARGMPAPVAEDIWNARELVPGKERTGVELHVHRVVIRLVEASELFVYRAAHEADVRAREDMFDRAIPGRDHFLERC